MLENQEAEQITLDRSNRRALTLQKATLLAQASSQGESSYGWVDVSVYRAERENKKDVYAVAIHHVQLEEGSKSWDEVSLVNTLGEVVDYLEDCLPGLVSEIAHELNVCDLE